MYSNAEYYDMVLCVGRAPNNCVVAARELYSEQHPGRPVPSYGCFLRLVNRLHSTDDFLDQRFEEWIGRAGTVPWPPRSPDLTPLDFFLVGLPQGNCVWYRKLISGGHEKNYYGVCRTNTWNYPECNAFRDPQSRDVRPSRWKPHRAFPVKWISLIDTVNFNKSDKIVPKFSC